MWVVPSQLQAAIQEKQFLQSTSRERAFTLGCQSSAPSETSTLACFHPIPLHRGNSITESPLYGQRYKVAVKKKKKKKEMQDCAWAAVWHFCHPKDLKLQEFNKGLTSTAVRATDLGSSVNPGSTVRPHTLWGHPAAPGARREWKVGANIAWGGKEGLFVSLSPPA